MAHTPEGRKVYALRKQTPEPVFGIIKAALGFRQFSLRGLDKVRGEWSLVTMAWNMKRMFALSPRGRARPGDEKADGCRSIEGRSQRDLDATKRPAEAGRGKIVLGVLLQSLSQTGC